MTFSADHSILTAFWLEKVVRKVMKKTEKTVLTVLSDLEGARSHPGNGFDSFVDFWTLFGHLSHFSATFLHFLMLF